ncbi:MAG: T9SS type A sorting domain-containing protein, partial [Bacteroidota bacterium]
TPCATGCQTVAIDSNNFNSWGIWNDGGSDCRRSTNDSQYANGGLCVRLRDNSGVGSSMTTDNLNLSIFEEITVDFNYLPKSMESGEDFWLQVDTGNGFQTVATWARGSEFQNDNREFERVTLTGNFTASTRFRFRCDASSNADRVYIDDVVLAGCANGSRQIINTDYVTPEVTETATAPSLDQVQLFPNPTRDILTVDFQFRTEVPAQVQLHVTDMTGKGVLQQAWNAASGKQRRKLDLGQLSAGIYLLHLTDGTTRVTKKFVVVE